MKRVIDSYVVYQQYMKDMSYVEAEKLRMKEENEKNENH